MRVFIADESPAVRSRLVRMLSDHAEVQVIGQTGDAREAISGIHNLKPDVVILAMHMYMGSGMEVLKAARQELPSAVIIIMTNSAYPQYRRECMRAGANYFLDKSIEFEKINTIFDQLKKSWRAPLHGQGNHQTSNGVGHMDRRRAA